MTKPIPKTHVMPPNMPLQATDMVKSPNHDPEKPKHVVFSTFIYALLMLFIIHSTSFLIEYIYQSYCYPITFWGFMTSTITTNSNTCVAIKNVVTNLNGFMSNYMLQCTGMFIMFYKRLLPI